MKKNVKKYKNVERFRGLLLGRDDAIIQKEIPQKDIEMCLEELFKKMKRNKKIEKFKIIKIIKDVEVVEERPSDTHTIIHHNDLNVSEEEIIVGKSPFLKKES